MGFWDEFLGGVAEGLATHDLPPAVQAACNHYFAQGFYVRSRASFSVTLKKDGMFFDDVVTLVWDEHGRVQRVG